MVITQKNTTFDNETVNRLADLTKAELVNYGVQPEDITEIVFELCGVSGTTYCITANNYYLFLGADLREVYTIVDGTSSWDEDEVDMRYRGSLLYDAGMRPA